MFFCKTGALQCRICCVRLESNMPQWPRRGPPEQRKRCISQISKCKLQNCGMDFVHDFMCLNFDFFILHFAFYIHQTLCLGAARLSSPKSLVAEFCFLCTGGLTKQKNAGIFTNGKIKMEKRRIYEITSHNYH